MEAQVVAIESSPQFGFPRVLMKDGYNCVMAAIVTQTQTIFQKMCQCLRVLSQGRN